MPCLAETQAAFARALLDVDQAVPAAVRGATTSPPTRRFGVYRNNVLASLIDALAAAYPAVQALVGEAFFRATAREFVLAQPPRSPLLIHYGGEFAAFLAGFPPAAKLPYLPDVARLEWAWLQAYHAADRTPATITLLERIPPQRTAALVFALHPSLALIRSNWPVHALWAASTGRGSDHDVDLERAEEVMVLRPAFEVTVVPLRAGAAAFAAALAAGDSLGKAADAGSADADFDLPAELVTLFQRGAVIGLAGPAAATDD